MGALKRIYKVFRWLLLVGLLTVVIMILWQATPLKTARDGEAPGRVQVKIAALQVDRARGQPHTLVFDEAELNSLLASSLELQPDHGQAASDGDARGKRAAPALEEARSNVRDVRVNLAGDKARGYIAFDLYGKQMSLILEGRLGVKEGYLHLRPTAGSIGTLPLPSVSLDAAVRRFLQSPQNREQLRLPPEIADVRVEGGALRVEYRGPSTSRRM